MQAHRTRHVAAKKWLNSAENWTILKVATFHLDLICNSNMICSNHNRLIGLSFIGPPRLTHCNLKSNQGHVEECA